jgi:SAM-dependent methyltransferase
MSAWPSPPPYALVGRHGVSPDTTLDERNRFNFVAQLNAHLASQVLPANQLAYERRVKPTFEKQHGGQGPQTRHDVRQAMSAEPIFQAWSALRRNAMEQRQQAGRQVVLRQLSTLNERAAELNAGSPRLQLDPEFQPPNYLTRVDHHCMPGGYFAELAPDDVSAAANYDVGIFATTAGGLGRYNDGAGEALAGWFRHRYPDFQPRRILDLGTGAGHSLLPLAALFPQAEVVAIDAAAPFLRFAHARAESLGIRNITFRQANAEAVGGPDGHFDLVFSSMFLHETSNRAIRQILRESRRVLAPGGMTLHLEQPQYPGMPVFEQFMRDWDAFYNNEPFWSGMHDLDIDALMVAAGFPKDGLFIDKAAVQLDPEVFGKPSDDVEDYGRKPSWHIFGAWLPKSGA